VKKVPPKEQAARLARAVPRLIKHLPHHKPWMVTLLSIATVVVLATCGLGSYLLVRDENTVVGADPNTTPTIAKRDITSRKTDPTPMTAADVFPTAEIVADPAIPPYKIVGKPQVAPNCRLAATAQVGKLLFQLGCNQVVRATFRSPDRVFFVTAGVLNLKDADSAAEGRAELLKTVNADNRLTGYISQTSAKVLGRAPTSQNWFAQGHFIVYTVIARVDGKAIPADDPNVKVIVYDILEKYLRDTVLANWVIDKSALIPSAAPPSSS
jgi:hypothetical protein